MEWTKGATRVAASESAEAFIEAWRPAPQSSSARPLGGGREWWAVLVRSRGVRGTWRAPVLVAVTVTRERALEAARAAVDEGGTRALRRVVEGEA